jgi:hypothetical protein
MVGMMSIFSVIVVNSLISNIADMPSIPKTDTVEFYYLETSLPINTPSDIRAAAGATFLQYASTHAGIGIWDITTGDKFTVQYLSSDFVGTLLPTLTPVAGSGGSGYVEFNNSGIILYTDPLDVSE